MNMYKCKNKDVLKWAWNISRPLFCAPSWELQLGKFVHMFITWLLTHQGRLSRKKSVIRSVTSCNKLLAAIIFYGLWSASVRYVDQNWHLKILNKKKNTAMHHCSKLFFNQFSNDLLHIIPKSKLQLNIWDQLSLIGWVTKGKQHTNYWFQK